MTARLARLALALYPLAYRRRYGAELAALVEDHPASARVVLDLLRAALVAHLRPEPAIACEVGAEERLRFGISAILLCWVFFAAAGIAVYKSVEGQAFAHAGGDHPLIGIAHGAILGLAISAAAIVLVGGAPLLLAATKQRRRPAVRGALGLAGGCLGLAASATAALVLFARLDPSPDPGLAFVVLGAWALVALAAGLALAVASRRGIAALDLRPGALRAATLAAVGLVVVMALIAIATGSTCSRSSSRRPVWRAPGTDRWR